MEVKIEMEKGKSKSKSKRGVSITLVALIPLPTIMENFSKLIMISAGEFIYDFCVSGIPSNIEEESDLFGRTKIALKYCKKAIW